MVDSSFSDPLVSLRSKTRGCAAKKWSWLHRNGLCEQSHWSQAQVGHQICVQKCWHLGFCWVFCSLVACMLSMKIQLSQLGATNFVGNLPAPIADFHEGNSDKLTWQRTMSTLDVILHIYIYLYIYTSIYIYIYTFTYIPINIELCIVCMQMCDQKQSTNL